MRETLISGDVWDADLANAAGNPILDGQDVYGHGAKVIDDWLDDQPDQIKARFYNWRDRLRLQVVSGLQVSYSGTVILRTDGNLVALPAGNLTLPNNSSGYIFVNANAEVTFATSYPEVGIPLVRYITSGGVITTFTDLRYQTIDIIQPLAQPQTSVFAVGDLKLSARNTPPTGWLECDGASYSTGLYPSLFAAIGTSYNLVGDVAGTFRVPDLRGRVAVGVGDNPALTERTIGQRFGAESVILNQNQLPSHTHTAVQNPHSHSIVNTPHNHAIVDSGHTHSFTSPEHGHPTIDPGHTHNFEPIPHSHNVFDPGHAHNITVNRNDGTGNNVADSNGGNEFISAPGAVNASTTGIGIVSSNARGNIAVTGSNINVQPTRVTGTIGNASSNIQSQATNVNSTASTAQPQITVSSTGQNQPVSTIQPSIALKYLIRAF